MLLATLQQAVLEILTTMEVKRLVLPLEEGISKKIES